jgi:hypothetical protein
MEYKQSIAILTNDQKREFLASVSSFANASGGDIIFEIKAQRPGNSLPLKGNQDSN